MFLLSLYIYIMIMRWIHVMSFCIGSPLLSLWLTIIRVQDSISTLMYHFYLESTQSHVSVFSSYLCVNVFIWWIRCCCICFKFWKNEYILNFLKFTMFLQFFSMFPRRCFPYTNQFFANIDVINNYFLFDGMILIMDLCRWTTH